MKDYKKIAVLKINKILNSSLDVYNYDNPQTKIEEFSDEDYHTYLTEYLHDELSEYTSRNISNKDVNVVYLKYLTQISVSVLNIINEKYQDTENETDWKELFETIKYELELHFGGRLKHWINVYSVTRHFGGNEEGGWYYNWHECVESKEVFLEHTEIIMDRLKERHSEGCGDIYSVLGGFKVEYRIENSRAESQTKERPYYE